MVREPSVIANLAQFHIDIGMLLENLPLLLALPSLPLQSMRVFSIAFWPYTYNGRVFVNEIHNLREYIPAHRRQQLRNYGTEIRITAVRWLNAELGVQGRPARNWGGPANNHFLLWTAPRGGFVPGDQDLACQLANWLRVRTQGFALRVRATLDIYTNVRYHREQALRERLQIYARHRYLADNEEMALIRFHGLPPRGYLWHLPFGIANNIVAIRRFHQQMASHACTSNEMRHTLQIRHESWMLTYFCEEELRRCGDYWE